MSRVNNDADEFRVEPEDTALCGCRVSFYSNGYIHFNRRCVSFFSMTEGFVDLFFDKDRGFFGFMFSSDQGEYSAQVKTGVCGSLRISAIGVLRKPEFRGLRGKKFIPYSRGGVIYIDTAEGEKVNGRR